MSLMRLFKGSMSKLFFTFVLGLCVSGMTQAGVVITVMESGVDVVASSSGSINTAGLTFFSGASTSVGVRPSSSRVRVGTGSATDLYTVTLHNSPAIGTGSSFTSASSGTGPIFGISTTTTLNLPSGYTSGSAISSTATWANTTFAGLGLTAGSYVFDWGAGGTADSITVNVGAVVPEPSVYASVAGLLALGFVAVRRSQRRKAIA